MNNEKDIQKYIDAYKKYYEYKAYYDDYDEYEEEEYDEDFIEFVNDFKAMENCKTNGELADWFNDYICNKGLESLYDIVNGENKDFESVSEWIDEVEQFEDIALWVEQVASGDIDRNRPVSAVTKSALEKLFAYEEYENGEDFFEICHHAQTTEKGEKTMNNENLDLPTFGYRLEIGVKQLVDFAFNKTDGLDMKDCLIEEVVEDFMEYDQVSFIERLEEKLDLPTTKEAEEVYYGINADEWSAILNVKFDRENANIQDIYDGRGGGNGTVTINADVTVNTTLFADICKEHGLEIKGDKMNSNITLDMLTEGSEYGTINLVPNNDAFMYTEDNKCINAEYECWFDVDKVFGTNTKNNGDRTVDFYTDYYPEDGRMLATVVVKDSNEGDTDFNYDLSDKEKEFLLDMMEKEAKREGYESLTDMWQKDTEHDNPEMEKY